MVGKPKARRVPALKLKREKIAIKIDVPVDLKDRLDGLRERAEAVGAEIDLRDLYASVLEESLAALAVQIEELEREVASRTAVRPSNGEAKVRESGEGDATGPAPNLSDATAPVANGHDGHAESRQPDRP